MTTRTGLFWGLSECARSSLHALAKTDVKIESVKGRVEVTTPEELVLNCGGAYIRLKGGDIELGC